MLVPIFIEAWDGPHEAQFQICRKIVGHLVKAGVSPLPFATTSKELASVLHALKEQKGRAGLFIVNTYWADEILKDLDAICGDTPILVLHREMINPHPWTRDENDNMSLLGLQEADTRPIVLASYGAKTVDALAYRSAGIIAEFLKDPRFMLLTKLDIRRPGV